MKMVVCSAHKFELYNLYKANDEKHELKLIDTYLSVETSALAISCEIVSIFANDKVSIFVLEKLKAIGLACS